MHAFLRRGGAGLVTLAAGTLVLAVCVARSHSSAGIDVFRFTWTRVRAYGGESLVDFTKSLGPIEKAVEISVFDVMPAFG